MNKRISVRPEMHVGTGIVRDEIASFRDAGLESSRLPRPFEEISGTLRYPDT